MAKPKPLVKPTPPPPPTTEALDRWVGTDGPHAAKKPRRKDTKTPSNLDTKVHALTMRLPADLYRELAHACVDRNCTVTAALIEGARLWLRQK
jgi:hypothetical protein